MSAGGKADVVSVEVEWNITELVLIPSPSAPVASPSPLAVETARKL
jgi:hypothetical protein